MKIIILFVCVSLTMAIGGKKRSLNHVSGGLTHNHIPIIKSVHEQSPEGHYKFAYESQDGSRRQEVGSGHGGASVHGSYAYITPEGKPVHITYVADEKGFRPFGNIISPEVQKSYATVEDEHLKRNHRD